MAHFAVRRSKLHRDRINSEERLLMIAGHRRMMVNLLFSDHNNHRLHLKLAEFPEQGSHVASVYGPVIFDPCPVLFFRCNDNTTRQLELVLTGSQISVDPRRIILQRVTLTGRPFKIHKRIVVVRFMFFNPVDVNYFRPVELQTKLHRRGHIKESLGTHGYMKCIFDKQIQHHDTVFMHLYKRIFPKWTMVEINY